MLVHLFGTPVCLLLVAIPYIFRSSVANENYLAPFLQTGSKNFAQIWLKLKKRESLVFTLHLICTYCIIMVGQTSYR